MFMYLDGYQKDVGDLVSYAGKLVMCVTWVVASKVMYLSTMEDGNQLGSGRLAMP